MKKYKDLTRWLIPILIVAALVIGLSELGYRSMVNAEMERCWSELAMVRNEAGREIGARLNMNVNILDLAADAIALNADFEDEGTVLSYLSQVQQESIFDRVDVIYPDGTVLVQCGEYVADKGVEQYQALLAKGAHMSQRRQDRHTGKNAICVYSPVYNAEGENIAVLGASAYCDTLAEIFYNVHYGDASCLFLIDLRDGCLVVNQWDSESDSIYEIGNWDRTEEYAQLDFVSDCMAGNTGHVAFENQADKTVSYMTYAPVDNTTFAVGLIVPEETVFANVDELRESLMWVGILEMAVLLGFALWIYKIIRESAKSEQRAQQAELTLLHQKEEKLQSQYEEAAQRQAFMETLAINLPGGYHRCTTDFPFRLTFVSNSFVQTTGYTLEQLEEELGGSYLAIVAPEDRDFFMGMAPQLERDGFIQCGYRIRRRDGQIRWVQDSTQYVGRDGEEYYQCALTDITEQIEEIEEAKRLAEASSQAKSTFLFNISHDIRTPMNAIKGFSKIVKENADDPQMVMEAIGKIEQAGDALILLMNDVLDISRIERGKEDLNLKPINLYAHGKALYEMFAGEMQAAGIAFKSEGDVLEEHVLCDELKLTRIMMNMLSNAKKFTPAGGSVTFGAVRLGKDEKSSTYRFFVRDTGIGMSPEFRKRAFQQFERERTSTESGISGSGLGLAIIKMLVELMGGTVEIQSELGKGTEISAVITFQLAEEDQIPQASRMGENTLDMMGKRILLVEDNDFNREIARYILEGMQCTVEEAENGAVCIEKLMNAEAGWFDLILMDIQMPVMDGYTATLEIRNLADLKKAGIPIIAMTANAFEEDKEKCISVGMNGHVGKPIDVDDLIQVLSGVLS